VIDNIPLSLVVLVPAHDEALVLDASLASLAQQDYPAAPYEIVVIADNCTDCTADIARARGATVWERTDTAQRGKGYALDWAIAQLLARPLPADAFVIMDADTWAAPDFLSLISTRLMAQTDARGLCALQGRYGVLNQSEGWRAALMSAAFDLVNHVRPLGRDRLGLSVGLKGNGMAFTRETLARVRWHGDSLTEDLDFALDLARTQNLRVGYAPEARVWAQMPTSGAQAASQRRRWEQGRRHSVRALALPLLWEGISRGRPLLIDSALDLLLPPLAELSGLLLFWLALIGFGVSRHILPYPALWKGAGAIALAGWFAYVLGGLRLAGASREAYLALLRAPFYMAWKAALALAGRRAKPSATSAAPEWVRTARAPLSVPGAAQAGIPTEAGTP